MERDRERDRTDRGRGRDGEGEGEGEDRDLCDASLSQGMPKFGSKPLQPRREAWNTFSLAALREPGLPAPLPRTSSLQTVRQHNSVVKPFSCAAMLYIYNICYVIAALENYSDAIFWLIPQDTHSL